MLKLNKKYKPYYLIFIIILFAVYSALCLYDFAVNKNGMRLVFGIVATVLTIVKGFDLYDYTKNNKQQ